MVWDIAIDMMWYDNDNKISLSDNSDEWLYSIGGWYIDWAIKEYREMI